jgi:hypothetical protein
MKTLGSGTSGNGRQKNLDPHLQILAYEHTTWSDELDDVQLEILRAAVANRERKHTS